jgi:hypothetical protein
MTLFVATTDDVERALNAHVLCRDSAVTNLSRIGNDSTTTWQMRLAATAQPPPRRITITRALRLMVLVGYYLAHVRKMTIETDDR